MLRIKKTLPADRADYTLGDLLFWHFKNGTRPYPKPGSKPREWDLTPAAAKLGLQSSRILGYYIHDENAPRRIEPFCELFFGDDPKLVPMREELEQKFEAAREARKNSRKLARETGQISDTESDSEPVEAEEPAGEVPAEPEPAEGLPSPAKTAAETPSSEPDETPPARSALPGVIPPKPFQPDPAPALNPAFRRLAVICLAGFIGGYLWYRWPHDLHLPKIAFQRLAPVVPSPSPVIVPPVIKPPPVLPPAPSPLPVIKPFNPPSPAPPVRPAEHEAAPPKPLEKARACIVGDSVVRDLVAAGLRRMTKDKIVSGECSATENNAIVSVSGVASTPKNNDPACDTIDRHQYELSFSVSWPGDAHQESRTISPPTRCASRNREIDQGIGNDLQNQAVLLGVISLRDILKILSEN